jgi:hypothetical protein
MTREQLEHIIRAAGAITGASEIVVIGSQAVLGQHPQAPMPLTQSIEADVFTFRDPEDATLIDGTIGEESLFHRTFGYHAHGVGMETAMLPIGWRDRLVSIEGPSTRGVRGLCLEVHDLAVSKLAAGRDKDIRFVNALYAHGYISESTVRARLADTQMTEHLRAVCTQRFDNVVSGRI